MTKFLVGLGLGTIVGVLVAPASGEETRRQLRHKADEKLGDVVRTTREKAGDISRRTTEQMVDKAAVRVAGEESVRRSYGS